MLESSPPKVSTSLPEFGEVWKRLKVAVGYKRQSDLSEALGITGSSISGAKARGLFPLEWAYKLALLEQISLDYILYGVGPVKRDEATPAPGGAFHQEAAPYFGDNAYRQAAGHDFGLALIKKVKARLSAGTGSLETEGDIKGFYSFREDWIHSKGNPENMVLMDVYGTSMEPEIRDGDTVLIDESKKEIYAGRVYAVGVDDEVLIKYIDKAPGKIVLRSKNVDEYPPIEIDLSQEHQSFRIIGRVIWWCREAR